MKRGKRDYALRREWYFETRMCGLSGGSKACVKTFDLGEIARGACASKGSSQSSHGVII